LGIDSLSSDGTGVTGITLDTLSKAVDMASELNLDETTVAQLKKDIAAARASKDEYISYYCY